MSHPSFFELDVHAVSPADDETAHHVKGCQQCAAHVAAVRVPAPFPDHLSLSLRERGEGRGEGQSWLPRLLVALAASVLLVAVAGIAKFMVAERADTTPKGLPAASLWLKRGDAVTSWKEGTRLSRDASVRWEIAPAGFTHVRVYDTATSEVLFEAKVPGDAPVLTPAWTFDGTRSTETIRVVLTRGDAPFRVDAPCRVDGQAWCSEYVLELEPR